MKCNIISFHENRKSTVLTTHLLEIKTYFLQINCRKLNGEECRFNNFFSIKFNAKLLNLNDLRNFLSILFNLNQEKT